MKLINDCVLCTVLAYATIPVVIYMLMSSLGWWYAGGWVVMTASTILGHTVVIRSHRRIVERIKKQYGESTHT